MATDAVNFTTGPTLLPDIGVCSYNGCTFSPLFESHVSGTPTEDEGNRAVKYVKVTIDVDGYVTLQAGAASISPTMTTLFTLLTAQGGRLTYTGRGFDINVNDGHRDRLDLAWGPVPEVLEFQPLGGGLSAKIRWRVTACVPAQKVGQGFLARWPKSTGADQSRRLNLLQFSSETSVKYGEDGFSTLTMSGTLEIALTRTPTQATRTLAYTADDMRPVIYDLVMSSIDLTRFRVTNRDFPLSRDKRTITWSVTAEEKPYMDLPPSCTVARGTFNVKPARTGPGLCLWMCSLSATYTLRAEAPRRQAWLLFLALLRLRMSESTRANIPSTGGNAQQQAGDAPTRPQGRGVMGVLLFGYTQEIITPTRSVPNETRRAMLMDFSVSEGLYLDSKTVTFSATWRLCTTFSHILIASGLWTKIREVDSAGRNLWAMSMRDAMGATSWLQNRVDPATQVIVDFGS